MEEKKVKSILEMARGSIMELADYEMDRIMKNIMDPNTKAAKARTLSLKVTFLPEDTRQTIQVKAEASSKLMQPNGVVTNLYIMGDEDGNMIAVEMTPQIPGQQLMHEQEVPQPAQLRLVKNG